MNVAATFCPAAEGSGRTDTTVAVVPAAFTVCAAPAEALPPKSASPAYVATRLREPGVTSAREQLPAATGAVQLSTPSLTVTLPVGVPPAGGIGATANDTLTACPTTVGVDARLAAFVTVVVVPAATTS